MQILACVQVFALGGSKRIDDASSILLEPPNAQLACVQVFALGGSKRIDDASETGYYAVRIALTRALTEAGEFIAEKGFVEEGAPVIVRLIARIASRFGGVVSEKAAAETVPMVGGAGV